LKPGEKIPYSGESWLNIRTTDMDQIDHWFEERPDMNYAVGLGTSGAIIDLDLKGDDEDSVISGRANLDALELEHDDSIQTFHVSTPSGGEHLYVLTDRPVSNANRFPEGIDVRGAYGYVVGPGCEIPGVGDYEVVEDLDFAPVSKWVMERFGASGEKSEVKNIGFELDTEQAINRAREYLKHREPAIEGEGGDEHTYVTACGVVDFSISEDKCLELMLEEWNDRCEPPWTPEELKLKAHNAWVYRAHSIGKMGGSFDEMFGDRPLGQDASTVTPIEDVPIEGSTQNWGDFIYEGAEIEKREVYREMLVHEWLPAHGLIAFLGKRGGGKTVVTLDIALRLACDMTWHGETAAEGVNILYLCGEDDEGFLEQYRAWVKHNGRRPDKGRFRMATKTVDLLNTDDVRSLVNYCQGHFIEPGKKTLVVVDTWQRASAMGSQNDDTDMQKAVQHAEAIAKSLNGPVIATFHPPKHDGNVVMGSSVIENATTAIWRISKQGDGRRVENIRMKGKGEGNLRTFVFVEVPLDEKDNLGEDRTGVVAEFAHGVGSDPVELKRDTNANLLEALILLERDRVQTLKIDEPYTAKQIAGRLGGHEDWTGPTLKEEEKADNTAGFSAVSILDKFAAGGMDVRSLESSTIYKNIAKMMWERLDKPEVSGQCVVGFEKGGYKKRETILVVKLN
jgi:hypothetical protein